MKFLKKIIIHYNTEAGATREYYISQNYTYKQLYRFFIKSNIRMFFSYKFRSFFSDLSKEEWLKNIGNLNPYRIIIYTMNGKKYKTSPIQANYLKKLTSKDVATELISANFNSITVDSGMVMMAKNIKILKIEKVKQG